MTSKHLATVTGHQTVDNTLFSPLGGRIALSANERICGFLDFAIQAKFAYINKLAPCYGNRAFFVIQAKRYAGLRVKK